MHVHRHLIQCVHAGMYYCLVSFFVVFVGFIYFRGRHSNPQHGLFWNNIKNSLHKKDSIIWVLHKTKKSIDFKNEQSFFVSMPRPFSLPYFFAPLSFTLIFSLFFRSTRKCQRNGSLSVNLQCDRKLEI